MYKYIFKYNIKKLLFEYLFNLICLLAVTILTIKYYNVQRMQEVDYSISTTHKLKKNNDKQ